MDNKILAPDASVIIQNYSIMQDFRENNQFCDIVLTAGEKCFPVHRVVIAAGIPYFRSRFSDKDFHYGRFQEISVREIKPSTVEIILNYAYGKEINLDDKNVENLLVASSFLLMNKLRDSCTEFLISKFNPENVLRIKRLADSINCIPLTTTADKYIRENFSVIAASDEFLSIELEEFVNFIGHDDLNVLSEENVYETCMSWLKYNEEKRATLLPIVLKNVRLLSLSAQFLHERVAQEPHIRKSVQSLQILHEAYSIHLVPEYRNQIRSFKVTPRRWSGRIYVLGGWSSHTQVESTVEVYDPIYKSWNFEEPLLIKKSNLGVVFLEDKIYAFGGYNREDLSLSSVEIFNPTQKKWLQEKSMLSKRDSYGIAVVKNLAYVCGGKNENGVYLNSVACFCPKTNEWTIITPMKYIRAHCCAVELKELLYVLGGESDKTTTLHCVECYNPVTRSWKEVKRMLAARVRFGAAVLNCQIFVCGGRNSNGVLQSGECYDPLNDAWKSIAPMNSKRQSHSLAAYLGKLWAIGGYDGTSHLSSVEEYDPENNTWTYVQPINCKRADFGIGIYSRNVE